MVFLLISRRHEKGLVIWTSNKASASSGRSSAKMRWPRPFSTGRSPTPVSSRSTAPSYRLKDRMLTEGVA